MRFELSFLREVVGWGLGAWVDFLLKARDSWG